jgi:ketosteroid isomerase-like protein
MHGWPKTDGINTRKTRTKNKRVVLHLFEALDKQDIERMGELVLSVNRSFHFSGMPSME